MREPGHIKRAARVDTRIETFLTDSDGNRIPVVVIDISRKCRNMAPSLRKSVGH
jgi:hypothetical protein